MSSWFQNLVVKNVAEDELEGVIEKAISYLINEGFISSKQEDSVLSQAREYSSGENRKDIVRNPDEDYLLCLMTNRVEVQKGRTVFWTNSEGFQSIKCPECQANNIDCDWSDLFDLWIENSNSADLQCKNCEASSSISEYKFTPKWILSNLGFVFWNWPFLKESFVAELEQIIGKEIDMNDGVL